MKTVIRQSRSFLLEDKLEFKEDLTSYHIDWSIPLRKDIYNSLIRVTDKYINPKIKSKFSAEDIIMDVIVGLLNSSGWEKNSSGWEKNSSEWENCNLSIIIAYMCKNRAIDKLIKFKTLKRNKEVESNEFQIEIISIFIDPNSRLIAEEIFNSISSETYKIIASYRIMGYNSREIGNMMKIGTRAIERKLVKIRKELEGKIS